MRPLRLRPPLTAWRTSSFCQNGECAELTEHAGEVMLRSTRDPKVVVRLTPAEWAALEAGIRAGEFSDLG